MLKLALIAFYTFLAFCLVLAAVTSPVALVLLTTFAVSVLLIAGIKRDFQPDND